MPRGTKGSFTRAFLKRTLFNHRDFPTRQPFVCKRGVASLVLSVPSGPGFFDYVVFAAWIFPLGNFSAFAGIAFHRMYG